VSLNPAAEDVLRVYDSAVFEFIKSKIKIPPGMDAEAQFHMATADRPFGFEFPLDNSGNLDTRRADLMLQTPQISLTRGSFTIDMTRNNTVPFRKVRWWDTERKMWVQSGHPVPWTLPYQIDIVGRLRNAVQACLQFFLYFVHPVRVLLVDFGYPWGKKYISLGFSDINDMTEYETGEELRYYRYAIPIKMEAYMFEVLPHPSSVPNIANHPDAFTHLRRSVHGINISIEDMNGNVLHTFDALPPE
jgi:hypothetical protein